MLAGPKKKQKWSQDPQNTAWANDQSRFGITMMKRMGWEKGKGLGANENGKVEPVKILKKNGNRGVGCSHSHENNWVAHQDDFSSLLSELNSHTSTNSKKEDVRMSVSCMEEKSKVQKRVHYKKFAKGKDLSCYKAADMDAIFGSRISQSLPTTPLNLSDVDDVSDTESWPESNKKPKSKYKKKAEIVTHQELSNVITSKLSITEYFKMKMESFESRSECGLSSMTKNEKTKEKKLKAEETASNCTSLGKQKKRHKKEKVSVDKHCNSLKDNNSAENILTVDSVKKISGKRKSKKSNHDDNKRSKIGINEV